MKNRTFRIVFLPLVVVDIIITIFSGKPVWLVGLVFAWAVAWIINDLKKPAPRF